MAVLLATLSAGCATVQPCPADGPKGVACRAERGDKDAQLQLGKAYEAGVGIAQDLKAAARLYRLAAAPSSGTIYVYSPPVGQARGQVIPIRTGADVAGLAEAKYRLALLYRAGRGIERDPERAAQLIREAAVQGYPAPDADD